MKKLIPIFLLSLLISCTNDKRSNNLEDKSINESQTKWAKDSIKQRLEDSVKLEARNNLLKDYLKKDSIKRNVFIKDSVSQVELEKMQLMASKDLDSIYPIWRDNKIDSVKMFKNKLANNNSKWEIERKIQGLKSSIDLVNWLISFEEEKGFQKLYSSKDTIKEIKNLIENLFNIPANNWKKMDLIHPLVGYAIYTTPGALIQTHRFHGDFDNIIDGYLDMSYVNNYIKAIYNHIDHPNFESVMIKRNSKGIFVNDFDWGGDGYLQIDFKDYVGYMVFDYFQKHHTFNFTDSLNAFFDSGLIDTNSLDWYKTRKEPYDYDIGDGKVLHKIIINSLSKTNSKNLALFIIEADNGNINFNLLNKTNKIIFIEDETISFKGNGSNGPTFKRINGKLYFYELNQMDVNGCIECCSIEWFDYYDKKSDCYLFK